MNKYLKKLRCNKYWLITAPGLVSKYIIFIFSKTYNSWALCIWMDKPTRWGIKKYPRDEWSAKELGPGYFWTFSAGKLFMLGKSVDTKEKL